MSSILRSPRTLHLLNPSRLTSSRPSCPLPRLMRFNSSNSSSEIPNPNQPETASQTSESVQDDSLAKKDAQIAEYKDLYIRARADYENLQKITTREKAQAKDYAIQSFAKDLVSNIDVLKLALDSVPESLRSASEVDLSSSSLDSKSTPSSSKHLIDLWKGVSSTKALLEQTLARFGVTPFDPTGEQFDPNRHEAMYQAPVPDKTPNSVLNCSKVGWMLRDRVLRPAQVGVVQGSE